MSHSMSRSAIALSVFVMTVVPFGAAAQGPRSLSDELEMECVWESYARAMRDNRGPHAPEDLLVEDTSALNRTLVIRFRIDRSRTVTEVQISEPSFDDAEMRSCVARVVASTRLLPRGARGARMVRIPLSFENGFDTWEWFPGENGTGRFQASRTGPFWWEPGYDEWVQSDDAPAQGETQGVEEFEWDSSTGEWRAPGDDR